LGRGGALGNGEILGRGGILGSGGVLGRGGILGSGGVLGRGGTLGSGGIVNLGRGGTLGRLAGGNEGIVGVCWPAFEDWSTSSVIARPRIIDNKSSE